ncbi:MAG: hypothetical protein JJE22_20500 [Bacteroidia bacterium]|nr:hypothetical protein [Bacteroidia bacterium]
MKKIIIISVIILLIISGGYYFIRYDLLKSKDFTADSSKEKSLLDLRPSIIAKLQQLVKEGSGGLYVLSIDQIEPDVLASKLDVIGGTFSVDTAVMQHMDSLKKLPDDIYHIRFDSLHIDGIGITDFLGNNNINIGAVFLTNPVISIYHKGQPYNKQEQKKSDSLTLYRRLLGQMKKIAVGGISIDHGELIIYDVKQKNHATKFNDITIRMNDVLIDSSTQYDVSRFLFAKQTVVETRNYSFAAPDSLYIVKLGTISLAGEKHSITILNAALIPRGNREQFSKKLPGRDEMYTIDFPKITLEDVDWWNLVNKEKIISNKTTIDGGTVSIFVDKSLPYGASQPKNHFPHQLVMAIPVPVLIDEVKVNDLKVKYEQYNPDTKSTGAAAFTNINVMIHHITNIPAEIKRSRYTVLSGSGLFMSKVPLTTKFKFDLLKQKTGQFTVDVHMDTLDKDVVNPVTEPLGKFSVKKGQMQEANVHIVGDNFNLHATADIQYTDLHITPLKGDSADDGLKKNHLKSFFANTLFIKNSNPKGNKLRQPEYDVARGHTSNFVSFIWNTIMTGLLKSVGIPVKLVMK